MQDRTGEAVAPVLRAMLRHWEAQPEVRLEAVRFAADLGANQLVKEDLTAFLLAASLDRMGNSFRIWDIPYRLKQQWGHLDTTIIAGKSPEELSVDPLIRHVPGMVSRLDLARTIISLAQIIEGDCRGNPEALFEGSVNDILARLQRISGVGPGIARMIVIQRLLYFGLKPVSDGGLLPKIDVHVDRVFQRTGLVSQSTEAQVRAALIGLSAWEIAIVDQVTWDVGKNYCFSVGPDCGACPLNAVCLKHGVEGC